MISPEAASNSDLKPASRVLIIGLDGATWNVLDPLIENGVLPNLEKLAKNGTRGILESTIPPITACAWPSFYTGRVPGNHGVFDFGLMYPIKTIGSKTCISSNFANLSKGINEFSAVPVDNLIILNWLSGI